MNYLRKEEYNFDIFLSKISVVAKPCEDLLWAWQNLPGILSHTRTKKSCSYSDPEILKKSKETKTFI